MCQSDCCWVEEYLAYAGDTRPPENLPADPSPSSPWEKEDNLNPWENDPALKGICSRCYGTG
jgi:hypothetical protein